MTAPIKDASHPVLSPSQMALLPIAALAASGDLEALQSALQQGLEKGLSVSEAREVLIQLYAYAGFPRSLNALGVLMQLVEERQAEGKADLHGEPPPRTPPKATDLRAIGTANQTKLAGRPVQGPLFDFAPAIAEYLQSHLFGAIFERDHLDWQHRELATVAMLAAISGTDPQLQAHIQISLNTGLSLAQLRQAADQLAQLQPNYGQRVLAAIAKLNPKPAA